MPQEGTFRPAWWLPGAHAQTVWGRLVRPARLVELRREVLETPDGDDLVLDHLEESAPLDAGRPRVVLLHGLEGSSYSVYVQGLLRHIRPCGWPATAINFRSCARDPRDPAVMLPNRRPRLYHSGETGDLDFVIRTLRGREPLRPLVAVGVSLGGNVLLKWLGENPSQKRVVAAATISVPYDLGAGSRHLENVPGRFYVGWFLKTLRSKAIGLAQRFPEAPVDVGGVERCRTFREFDDAATAPLHGFRDADDYYTRCSSLHFAGRIAVPTLCLSAEDDPFLPAEVLPRFRAAASPCVEIAVTRRGGHAGFVCGPWPRRCRFWAEEFVISWLAGRANHKGTEDTKDTKQYHS